MWEGLCPYSPHPHTLAVYVNGQAIIFATVAIEVEVHGTLVSLMYKIYYAVWKVYIREQINDWPGPFDAKRWSVKFVSLTFT